MEFGVMLDSHRARALTEELVRTSDLILVMDFLNEARLLGQFPGAKRKVRFLGAFDDPGTALSVEIADPYVGGDAAVRDCFVRIARCVEQLAKQLRDNGMVPEFDAVAHSQSPSTHLG